MFKVFVVFVPGGRAVLLLRGEAAARFPAVSPVRIV